MLNRCDSCLSFLSRFKKKRPIDVYVLEEQIFASQSALIMYDSCENVCEKCGKKIKKAVNREIIENATRLDRNDLPKLPF